MERVCGLSVCLSVCLCHLLVSFPDQGQSDEEQRDLVSTETEMVEIVLEKPEGRSLGFTLKGDTDGKTETSLTLGNRKHPHFRGPTKIYPWFPTLCPPGVGILYSVYTCICSCMQESTLMPLTPLDWPPGRDR